MAPRWFLGNFDFEHQLAQPGRALSARLQRINAELATCWLAIAADGDYLWTPEPIAEEFWDDAVTSGLPRVIPTRKNKPDPAHALVPWGWSPELLQLASDEANAPTGLTLEIVRYANSRRTSMAWEQAWGTGIPGAAVLQTVADAAAAIAQFSDVAAGWVIKAEFGMSGRERLLGRGPLQPSDIRWLERRLAHDGVVFFEPWVERLCEAGLQYQIPPQGPVEFLGVAEMLPATRGQYAGTWFTGSPASFDWTEAISVGQRAAAELQAARYHGPLGIDAMWYRSADGNPRCRPLQDINARWTMGRLALGWRQRFPAVALGYWWHGSATALSAGQHLLPLQQRGLPYTSLHVICTTPSHVGSHATQHASAIVMAEPGPQDP